MKSLALALVSLAACGTTDSNTLLTAGMSADISAEATGTGHTRVSVSLYSGYPEQLIFVDLKGDDQLIASSATEDLPLDKSQLLTIISYSATFAGDAEGDQFNVDLQRTLDAGAPSSVATLPGPFDLDPIATSASRAQPFTFSWSPSGASDQMQWEAAGDCVDGGGTTSLSDDGSFTIPANTLVKRQTQNGQTYPDTCTVTLTVRRLRDGVLDSHYGKGGSVTGWQTRTATFTTTP
jgi:hypothetical protein